MSSDLKLKPRFLTPEQRKQKKIESNKKYYSNNKHTEARKIKIDCITCGGRYCYYSKSRHFKSKKHLFCANLLNSQKVQDV